MTPEERKQLIIARGKLGLINSVLPLAQDRNDKAMNAFVITTGELNQLYKERVELEETISCLTKKEKK